MAALPTYFLSIYKAPKGFLHSIESIFKWFLWERDDCKDKIHCVAWQEVCKEKEGGRLGLKSLRAFNFAFLGKWLWRMWIEKTLWYEVLISRYGRENGKLHMTRKKGSRWWRDLCSLENLNNGFGERWFLDATSRRLRDGVNTLFWHDYWTNSSGYFLLL